MVDDEEKRTLRAIEVVRDSGGLSSRYDPLRPVFRISKPLIPRTPPNWDLWADMLYASLTGAVLLSLDFDPDQKCGFDEGLVEPGAEAERRLRVAVQRATFDGLWRNLSHRSGLPPEECEVVLPKFAAFAERLGWKLPDRFPGRSRTDLPSSNEKQREISVKSEIDPSDLPPELHAAINADSFRALQADLDAARAELEKAKACTVDTIRDLEAMRGERDSLQAMADEQTTLKPKAETTYLNVIGALLELVRSPRPGRDSDAAVIRELIENYSDKPGISKTTLEAKFADARRRLNST